MKIIIAGGSGFLGENLTEFFTKKQHEVKILTRNPKKSNEIFWDAKNLGDWQNELENADVLINLTGKSVDCRYNAKNRAEIYNSRIQSTAILQKAVDSCENPPKIWLNAGSATIYAHSETNLNTEESPYIGDDFSANICKSWEAEFFKINDEKIRKIALRTSIVFGKNGGAFPRFLQVAKLGIGGKQGSGEQMVSWLHIRDFCRAVEFIIENQNMRGGVNITAPNPVKNQFFMQKLRKKSGAKFGLNSPVWLLEIGSIFLRTETELMLKSRNVFPKKVIDSGFQFEFPTLETALDDLLK